MSEVDWSKAPEGAEFYANEHFRKVGTLEYPQKWGGLYWVNGGYSLDALMKFSDYCERPKEWPTDDRINAIAQNGNTGEHYAVAKHDTDKPRYDLLPPVAIDLMAQVMTFGAKKYKPEGWRTVPDALQRYQAALLRHSFAMLRGEVLDAESGLPHAAHAMCCAAFIAELQKCKPTT
jgi:Domain of unknown function (DUF5664)